MELDQAIALTAHDEQQAKSDMAHRFIQEPSFAYFTGITAPGWLCLYDGTTWYLQRPGTSETKALFDGSLSDDNARRLSGIDSVISADEGRTLLENLSSAHGSIATIGPDPMRKYYEFQVNGAQAKLNRLLKKHFGANITDCRPVVKRLRAIKSDAEIAVMRQAIAVTVDAFRGVHETIDRFDYEYQVEAVFNAAFRATGAGGHAYEPIVAGGANACVLHYQANQSALPENGLLLLDIGAQVDGYAADITRTYALGTPTQRQRSVHGAVERAHHAIIALIKPGVAFADYHHSVDEIMQRALEEIGVTVPISDSTYRTYFPHAISHGLGIDVHESLGGYDTFMPGMVLTVEPGIYIAEEGIGVRIEDDILVTASGSENLSGSLSTRL